MKTTPIRRNGRGFTLVELLVVITIIVALASFAVPQIIKIAKNKDKMTATNNARQLGFALTSLMEDYGGLPDSKTAEDVKEKTGTKLTLTGDTANDYFRQLIASKKCENEQPFYAYTSYSKKKGDNVMNGNEALKPGEVGFCYIMDGSNGTVALSASKPTQVLAATPVENASKGEFDVGPLDGKAVVLKSDWSVEQIDIRPDNKKLYISKGKTLLDTGEESIWGEGVKPVIKMPKKK